jgi:histidinol-phosphate aminotransferase
MTQASPGRLVVPAVRSLSRYVPGKPISELEREYGISDIVKLASNENPWGASPQALAAMRAAIDDVWLYPDGSSHALRAELAQYLGVAQECLTLGNGSNDLLMLLAEATLTPAHNAVYSQYGFAIYPLVIHATGAAARVAPALPTDSDMPLGHDLDAMAARIDGATRLVFIANPNNPTGSWLDNVALKRFIANAGPDTLVVLDEAYFEYARCHGVADGVQWLDEFPNLVVLRTFSKAWGLAGARAGYAVSHPEVADALNRLRPAFNVNSLAQAGAQAALRDRPHMEQCVANTLLELRFMQEQLGARGLTQVPSAANFLLVRFGATAARINEALLRGGVIVRPVAGYGLPEYLRITMGTREHNLRLLQVLDAQRGQAW